MKTYTEVQGPCPPTVSCTTNITFTAGGRIPSPLSQTRRYSVALLTWNCALMLGGFFFLWRCSRDLVMRSGSVRLLRYFSDFTLTRCCRREIRPLATALKGPCAHVRVCLLPSGELASTCSSCSSCLEKNKVN